jgi:hypothetical protein
MSYAQLQSQVCNQTGGWSRQAEDFRATSPREWSSWPGFWNVLLTPCYMAISGTTASLVTCAFEALPIRGKSPILLGDGTKKMLKTIENVFGPSASDMARILNVSRPMIYHYRGGMEPELENMRRLQVIAEVASEFRWLLKEPLTSLLKAEQPEGRTLLDYLSDEHLDIPVVRRVVQRDISAADEALRNKFADAMIKGQSRDERRDIVRERHKAGKPVYVGDPGSPGKLIQILPNGRRVRGRMEKRRFIPDDE